MKRKPYVHHAQTVRNILGELFGAPAQRSFAVRLWDGSVERPPTGQTPDFTLVLKEPGALRRMLLPPSELALGEAYLRDDFDIEGDMEAATGLADSLTGRLRSPASLARLVSDLLSLPSNDLPTGRSVQHRPTGRLAGLRHSRGRDATAVRSHYDVGNDFYALWLDSRMVYSCAYFERGTETLDTAQAAKLEHICCKLRLQPGERLLDIGCGWGGLAQYAAEHYGVEVVGITLSEPQAEWARSRIKEAGLGGRCRIEVRDYRDLGEQEFGKFDKIVSVGMFEHVGRAKLPLYFQQAYRLLKPGGVFLNHGIVVLTSNEPSKPLGRIMERVWRPGEFVWRYVFPDGELVTPGEVIALAEGARFETRDVESLREHYAHTLRHWVWRLEANHKEAVRLVGEQTYRVWRLYMAACARAFATGRIGIIQTLLSKPTENGSGGLPLTRADLYR
ncbi:MAG: class I SAM-dependent methyltransferase [Chloroflexi bacterium]|nr:class I SAM-dependent methyltransferase [Chloroflexota bacterium]